jgi:hypothetical protein
MSDYRLEISSSDSRDIEKLNYLLGFISAEDNLKINMKNVDSDTALSLINTLTHNSFEVSPKEYKDARSMNEYNIVAKRIDG